MNGIVVWVKRSIHFLSIVKAEFPRGLVAVVNCIDTLTPYIFDLFSTNTCYFEKNCFM